jgi:hypothetical protein
MDREIWWIRAADARAPAFAGPREVVSSPGREPVEARQGGGGGDGGRGADGLVHAAASERGGGPGERERGRDTRE